MKNRHILKRIIAVALALVTLLSIALPTDTTYAASSYTDPYYFYNTCNNPYGSQHIEFTNQGYFYYGTRSLAASSSKNDRFRTIGWAITLSAGGQSVDIYCANGQTIEYLSSPAGYIAGDGYNYMLYRASYNKLAALAYARNPAAAEVVFSQSEIDVSMAALITVVQGGTGQLLGAVSEYGNGLIAQSGTVWNAYSDVNTILSKFATFNYADYVLHYPAAITNYKLEVYYKSEDVNKNTSTQAVSSIYSIASDKSIHSGGNVLYQKAQQLGTVSPVSPSKLGLSKVGYHIEAGSEWVIEDTFVQVAAGYPYYTSQLNYRVNYQDCSTTLVANWQPNLYTVHFNANGGSGVINSKTYYFDEAGSLAVNSFTRTGYQLVEGKEWNTKLDGSGTSYSTGQMIKNLATENGAELTLYANWEPCIYTFVEDKAGGTGGTDVFYQKYDTGFYSEEGCTNLITSISIPGTIGYNFCGRIEKVDKRRVLDEKDGDRI